MEPWWEVPANPSAAHRAGQRASAALEDAREAVAALVGRPAAGIVFGSGATEANHHAMLIAWSRGARRAGVAGVEHPGVKAGAALAGLEVVPLPVDSEGRIALLPVDVLCCMAVNHETGVRQDVEAAVAARTAGLVEWVHCDAAQALGKGAVAGLGGVDSAVVSAHKLGGPIGVGALSLLDRDSGVPLFGGGGQERGLRSGTVNVPGVVGFGAACRAALRDAQARWSRWTELAERLRAGLRALGAREMGAGAARVPTHTCVVFDGVEGETLVQALDLQGIAVSSGSACASGSSERSPVLVAMGEAHSSGALRVSLGPDTQLGDVERLLAALPRPLDTLSDAR